MAKKKVKKEMFFIASQVPSSKNSRITNRATGRSFPSKNTQKYVKNTKSQYLENKETFLKMLEGKEKPYLVEFHFVRDSKRRWDFGNICQVCTDLMTTYEFIEDDNVYEMFPIPLEIEGKLFSIDKNNPGVWISVK